MLPKAYTGWEEPLDVAIRRLSEKLATGFLVEYWGKKISESLARSKMRIKSKNGQES